MNIDTERVISEVHLRPPLWDLSCALYKVRDAKIKAWFEVCQAIVQNYDHLSDNEKKVIGNFIGYLKNTSILPRYTSIRRNEIVGKFIPYHIACSNNIIVHIELKFLKPLNSECVFYSVTISFSYEVMQNATSLYDCYCIRQCSIHWSMKYIEFITHYSECRLNIPPCTAYSISSLSLFHMHLHFENKLPLCSG
ncbi:MADF domain-containing protein [Aphis craccivora]|uniref:MADF domain-containing protein n=1 Tax=Aphis craccivora TaxID=307492 RepID=A0A6G0VNL7_APHCR|nr:MADF domain-containing protein [Aphis craccivora]